MSSGAGINQPTKKSFAMPGSTFVPSNASILLDKKKPGIRRSTPDSEALASSDDELESQHQSRPLPKIGTAKPGRRPSWLNEIPSSSQQRKSSMSNNASFSQAGSHPTTPSAEQTTWGSTTSPGLGGNMSWTHASNPSFPWSTGIWNSENRGKEPPSRLKEVIASPTATTGNMAEEFPRGSGESAIPFAIPLHPTPKTYRSQSYSVGQLEPEALKSGSGNNTNPLYAQSRAFPGNKYQGLQHRPSRPSMLGEYPTEGLGQVREDEDSDSGNGNGSDEHPAWAQPTTSIPNDQLSMEGLPQLRQVVSNPPEPSRFRERAASSSAGSNYGLGATYRVGGPHRIQSSVPEESDLAIEDFDQAHDGQQLNDYGQAAAARRFSEAQANYGSQYSIPSFENRALENVKKAHWQTSLGFPGIIEQPQSRRHSFAEPPARHGSITSNDTVISPGLSNFAGSSMVHDDPYAGFGSQHQMSSPVTDPREYQYFLDNRHQAELEIEREHLRDRIAAESYFAIPQSRRMHDMPSPPPGPPMQHGFNPYGRNLPHPSNQLLYIVTFKCCRADVFYIQEDTGLQVQPGDLVIVEADRGTDLGTVAHVNVSWAQARAFKDHYAEEHYKWLMLFSQQNRTGAPNAVNPNGLGANMNGAPGSAIGGMGPPGHGSQEAQSSELKPKLIKRLAQNHEIQCLREKEGNEAKAKRVCQQKVLEHRLNMEILDAECQMDWKKLTFYYFADTYINFNSLVTDLFKIYKTRIWMSAINPASFSTPTAGLQPPPLIGPGALAPGFGTDSTSFRRPQERDGVPRAMYMDPYEAFGQPPRQTGLGLSTFGAGMPPQADPFASYSPSTSALPYLSVDQGLHNYVAAGSNGHSALRRAPGNDDFTAGMQGLSLT